MSLTAAGDVNLLPPLKAAAHSSIHSSSSLLPQLSDADIQGYRDAYEPRMDEMHAFNMVKRRLQAGSIVRSRPQKKKNSALRKNILCPPEREHAKPINYGPLSEITVLKSLVRPRTETQGFLQ